MNEPQYFQVNKLYEAVKKYGSLAIKIADFQHLSFKKPDANSLLLYWAKALTGIEMIEYEGEVEFIIFKEGVNIDCLYPEIPGSYKKTVEIFALFEQLKQVDSETPDYFGAV